ncbi:hypothetical protein HCA69_15075 [Listeria grandensis]|uniref:Bacterial Ig domain-containing protein n=1 Tax=Listeria grandensis TaxID=1494963 RepID=A0A7X1CR39_9LIST|nr:Ig-like domain-containing protein [Listeria grandensis]MBC1937690.1 hypothetical protein [Listeria grandensis]
MKAKKKVIATALLSGACIYLSDVPSLVDEEKVKVKAAMVEQEVNPLPTALTPLEPIFSDITSRAETPMITLFDRPYPNSKYLTGKGIPGATLSARVGGAGPSSEVGSVKVSPDGNFSINVGEALKDCRGNVYIVQIIDGKESPPKYLTVDLHNLAPENVSSPTVATNITSNTTKIIGKAEPEAIIIVKSNSLGLWIGDGRADKNGNFEVTIPSQLALVKLHFQQISKGIASSIRTTQVAQGLRPVHTLSPVKEGDTKVTGKGTAGATVRVKVGSIEIGNGKVDSQGNFNVAIDKQLEGTKLSITQANGDDESEAVVVTVGKSTQLEAVAITTHYVGATYLRGTAPAGATKVTLKVGGKNIRTVDVATDNSFRIYANDVAGLKQVGTIFELVAQDASGQLSKVATSTVEEVPVPELDAFKIGQTHVTGKVAKGMTRISLYDKTGKLLRNGEINADGTFRILASDLPALRFVGDTFTVTVTSATGVISKASEGIIEQDGSIAAAPTITDYYLDDTYITGKVSAGATKIFLRINGKAVRGGTIAADGSYRIYANSLAELKLIGATFEVVTQDANNKYSEVAKGEVRGMSAPTVAPYRSGQINITGTVSKEAAKISVYDKAGTLIRNGQINADGTFRIYVSGVAAFQVAGDSFTVRAFNANGSKSSETRVVILPK